MICEWLRRCSVILLDQGRTFMFENDRFGPGENYFLTYREFGGSRLSAKQVNVLIRESVGYLRTLYGTGSRIDAFPSVAEAIRELNKARNLDSSEFALLDEVVARHEVGSISTAHAKTIASLARTHRLGIVSNIWGGKAPFEENMKRAAIYDYFEHLVWSSDFGCIKPARRIFHHARELFQVPAAQILFVGDDPWRDIAPAHECGFATVWIQADDQMFPSGCPAPDLIIGDLEELAREEKLIS